MHAYPVRAVRFVRPSISLRFFCRKRRPSPNCRHPPRNFPIPIPIPIPIHHFRLHNACPRRIRPHVYSKCVKYPEFALRSISVHSKHFDSSPSNVSHFFTSSKFVESQKVMLSSLKSLPYDYTLKETVEVNCPICRVPKIFRNLLHSFVLL